MKADLEHFRKFSISDFRISNKKFKEYLDFCRKNDLVQEKKYILESLVNTTNDKSIDNNNDTPIMNDLTTLSVLAVLFSDMEIESYIDIPNFSLSFQKRILYETIIYCSDRLQEQKNYIEAKYQFWVLKTINKTLSISGDQSVNNIIEGRETESSLNSLCELINQNFFESMDDKMKVLLVKIAYELGLYYYLTENDEKMLTFFKFAMKNMVLYKPTQFYFDQRKIEGIIYITEKDIEENNLMQIDSNDDANAIMKQQDPSDSNQMPIKEYSHKFLLDINESVIQSDYNKINEQLANEKIASKYIITSINLIDYSTIDENIMKSQNLISLSMKNIDVLKEAIQFANRLKDAIDAKLTKNGLSALEKKNVQNANKEISYQLIILILAETLYAGEKLPRNFLKNLSKTILEKTLTDDLRISGLIHSSIINFIEKFEAICNYFIEFVNFFRDFPTKIETVNQIELINYVLQVFKLYHQTTVDNTISKEIIIRDDLYNGLLRMFIFWIGPDMNVNHKTNIAFIMIETIKILDYLIILKLIFLGVLKCILDKKHLSHISNDVIYDTLYEIEPVLFKIDSVINKGSNQSFSSEQYNATTITFIEDKKANLFNADLIPVYIKTLFTLMNKIEKKIIHYGKFTDEDIVRRKINLRFFERLEGVNQNSLIVDYAKMIKLRYADFKQRYFNKDILNNIEECIPFYDEFKALFDRNEMIRFIYVLNSNQKYLEAAILCQYFNKCNYDLVYKLLKKAVETNINFGNFQYIWKTVFFEYLTNFYYTQKKEDVLNQITLLMKRISNHQFFCKHPLRKHFKIINFFKFIDDLI